MNKLTDKKEGLLSLLWTVAFFASGFFLFGPLQLYISNITELWFPITDVLWPSLIVFVLAVAILFAVGCLFCRWEKLFYGFISLLWGLGLALYIQGNFIQTNYGILNGETIDWSAYGGMAVLNALLWAVCLALPFVLRAFVPRLHKTIINYAACGLVLVQLVAVMILCFTTNFSTSAVADSFLSNSGLYEVSDKQNVIVFILDTFDQDFFEEVYEDDPDFVDFLDGFTYFSNATAPYPYTKAAIPYLLTGQYYENRQPYSEYINEAWRESADYYQILKRNGFDIGIYTTMEIAVSDEAKATWIDNAVGDRLKVSSHIGLEKSILQLTAMRYFPDAAKKYVWAYDSLFGGLKSTIAANAQPFSEEEKDTVFYQGLISQRLTVAPGKKYKFIHLDGVHPPYTVLEDVSNASGNGHATSMTEARGSLNIIREYIRQLKVLDIYDQTCIIITGDHGYNRAKSCPILLVKGFDDGGELQFSNAPVSHTNLMATVIEELNLKNVERFGQSVFVVNANSSDYRRYLLYAWGDSRDAAYLPDMVEYYILPDNNGSESYILTGRTYTSSGVEEAKPYQCRIGESIIFDNSNSLSHFLSGITQFVESDSNEDYIWSIGYNGRACFRIDDAENDLICHIQLNNYVPTGSQHIIIVSRGVTLYDAVVTSDMPYINFAVPKECVQDDLLVLDFEYPDACSAESLGSISGDTRILAIGFVRMVFSKQEETNGIVLSQTGNGGDYFYGGWHALENTWSWTNETASILAILPSETGQMMSVTYGTHPGANDTSVYYNGEYVGTLPHHDHTNPVTEKILLPAVYQSDSDAQVITFVTDGATTSKEYYGGNAKDTRVLGIAVSEIHFDKTKGIDEPIVFNSAEALGYFTSGVTNYFEGDYMWSLGHSGNAVFHLGNVDQDLTCHIRLNGYVPAGSQHIMIKSRSVTLYDTVVTSDMPYINFAVPKECVQDGLLALDFEYPDACSSKSLGLNDSDERLLAIAFKEILFTRQETAERIVFSSTGNGGNYFYGGWHALENTWSWTNETASVLIILPSETDQQMSVTYWTHPGANDTSVYYNGEYVGTLPHHNDTEQVTETIFLPAAYKSESDAQVITFVTDGATTSKEYYGGDVSDTRVLGIAVSDITFAEVF